MRYVVEVVSSVNQRMQTLREGSDRADVSADLDSIYGTAIVVFYLSGVLLVGKMERS